MTSWAHLPAAATIDRIILSTETHMDDWLDTNAEYLDKYYKTWDTPNYDAWAKACNKIEEDGYEDIWHELGIISKKDGLNYLVNDALAAIIAYPECTYMLDSDPGELAIIAILGNEQAILLYPACLALSKGKVLNKTQLTQDASQHILNT